MSQLLRRRGIIAASKPPVIVTPPPPIGIAPPNGPWTNFNGNFTVAKFDEQAYFHTGVPITISKLNVINCTDIGIGAMQWQPPDPVSIPGFTTCLDCKADHITRNPPKTSNGTAEACFWFGNPFKVSRIVANNGGWMGIWTGNRAVRVNGGASYNWSDPSYMEDFVITGGNAVGLYIEHDTNFAIFRRGLINQSGGTAVVSEWWYSGEAGGGTMHGSHDIIFDSVEFYQEIFLDAGTYGFKFRNCKFHANVRFPTKLMDPTNHNVSTANRNYTNLTHPNPNVIENTCQFVSGSLVYHSNNIGWNGQ